jgi:hypothetical protein
LLSIVKCLTRGVSFGLDRRDDFGALERDRAALLRIDGDLERLGEQISGRALPVLSFPAIRVHPDRLPVGAVVARVDAEEPLCEILAGRNVGERLDRVT